MYQEFLTKKRKYIQSLFFSKECAVECAVECLCFLFVVGAADILTNKVQRLAIVMSIVLGVLFSLYTCIYLLCKSKLAFLNSQRKEISDLSSYE
jgi:hypothetical protein